MLRFIDSFYCNIIYVIHSNKNQYKTLISHVRYLFSIFFIFLLCRIVMKTEQNRLAVREQIKCDNKQHQLIENVRNEEKKRVLKELDSWKSMQTPINNDQSTDVNILYL